MKNKLIIPKVEKGILVICPKCSNNHCIKRGNRYNLYRGKVQRYSCKKCSNRFSVDATRMRYPDEVIGFSLKLLENGFSSREITKKIIKKYGLIVTHQSIFRWAEKFDRYRRINYDRRFLNQLLRIRNKIKNRKKFINKYVVLSKKQICNTLLVSNNSSITRWRIYYFGILKRIGDRFFINVEELNKVIDKLIKDV